MGHIKKVFPGGNTALGFYSFYEYIAAPDANKVFVVKGGPGVGKSTFMRTIGEALVGRGFDVEFHCCSSDNGSLDGIYVPSIDLALIDGTAPHVIDPRNPGAVDEIIHLGDHWDEEGLRANKRQIVECNREVARLFRRAYAFLAAAKLFLDQVESYYQDTSALDVAALDALALELAGEMFDSRPAHNRNPRVRRLFASAITPDGPVNYLETLVGHLNKRYIINGDDGTGKTTLIRRLLDAAVIRGYEVEAYHCALNPVNVDHFVVPELSIAVINGVEPHLYKPQEGDTVLDTMNYVNPGLDGERQAERDVAREMYRQSLDQAVWFINRAKKVHDEMETYYVPNMHFDRITDRREEVLGRILDLAQKTLGLT